MRLFVVGLSIYTSHLVESVVGGLAGRELRVAVVCPLPSRGLCCGRETPRARRLSLGEVLGDLESSAGADLGNDFPSEVELSSMWKLNENVGCWEAVDAC